MVFTELGLIISLIGVKT